MIGIPFTPESARIAAHRSHSARMVKSLRHVEPDQEAQMTEDFRKLRLARVRKQLLEIDRMMTEEADPGKLDRLASASIRLNEQERQLSNRSLPATVKSSPPPKSRKLIPAGPISESSQAKVQAEPVQPPSDPLSDAPET